MYPPSLQKLIDIFTAFPGIGPRQAARFAFFLTAGERMALRELADALKNADASIMACARCYRTIEKNDEKTLTCTHCRNERRNTHIIAVIERETDMQNMERAGIYQGLYHVLHGVISPLDQDSPKRLHLRELYDRVNTLLTEAPTQSVEIILATNSTQEGDTTARYIERVLAPLKETHPHLAVTRLGRGLSLGAELEYADEITLKSALANRK